MHLFPSPAHITKARETTPFVANFLLKVFEATEIVPRLRRGRRTSPAEMKISKGMGAHLWEKDASRARCVRQRLHWVTDIKEVKRRFRLTATTHATATASTLSGDWPTYPRFPQIANHSRLYQKDETRNQRKGNADAQSRHD